MFVAWYRLWYIWFVLILAWLRFKSLLFLLLVIKIILRALLFLSSMWLLTQRNTWMIYVLVLRYRVWFFLVWFLLLRIILLQINLSRNWVCVMIIWSSVFNWRCWILKSGWWSRSWKITWQICCITMSQIEWSFIKLFRKLIKNHSIPSFRIYYILFRLWGVAA
jgi:hypothetical protein